MKKVKNKRVSVREKVMGLARIECVKRGEPIDGGIRVLAARLGAGRLNKRDAWTFVCGIVGVDVSTLCGWTKEIKTSEHLTSKEKFDAFYKTKEWQRLRYQAFVRYGKVCNLCGAGGQLHVDHIKPRSKYPELESDIGNLQILCVDCNYGKGGWDETDWRPRLVVSNR